MIELVLSLAIYQQVITTNYTASFEECGKSDGITASGLPATEGVTIASDHLPFGTLVDIDGHIYMVQDRFGAGHTDRIDIFVEDRGKALEYGSQEKMVKVLF